MKHYILVSYQFTFVLGENLISFITGINIQKMEKWQILIYHGFLAIGKIFLYFSNPNLNNNEQILLRHLFGTIVQIQFQYPICVVII